MSRSPLDIRAYNRVAWDKCVERHNPWTVPVGPEVIARARQGDWEIVLTPRRSLPRNWFPAIHGLPTLCLASGGGQQGPVLAAAGARVTVLDNSPKQLAQDRLVAQRDDLCLELVEGDMRDLSRWPEGHFGLIVNPCSTCFIPDVRRVWEEACRILRPGGVLVSGFINPLIFIFDDDAADRNELMVRHMIPYSDLTSLTEEECRQRIARGDPLYFGHSLEDLIGGQLEAGFLLTGFLEDAHPETLLAQYLATFINTRAVKP